MMRSFQIMGVCGIALLVVLSLSELLASAKPRPPIRAKKPTSDGERELLRLLRKADRERRDDDRAARQLTLATVDEFHRRLLNELSWYDVRLNYHGFLAQTHFRRGANGGDVNSWSIISGKKKPPIIVGPNRSKTFGMVRFSLYAKPNDRTTIKLRIKGQTVYVGEVWLGGPMLKGKSATDKLKLFRGKSVREVFAQIDDAKRRKSD